MEKAIAGTGTGGRFSWLTCTEFKSGNNSWAIFYLKYSKSKKVKEKKDEGVEKRGKSCYIREKIDPKMVEATGNVNQQICS